MALQKSPISSEAVTDMNRLALVHAGVTPEVVVTFVRPDTKSEPPQGFAFVMEDSLSPGWRLQNDEGDRVPESVEAWKFREWLIRNGHSIEAIDDAIAQIPDQTERELIENQWGYNISYARKHPMLSAFMSFTCMTEAQIDKAFREALEIQ